MRRSDSRPSLARRFPVHRWSRAIVVVVVALVALSGCVQNAALEIELTLPQAPAGSASRYVLVQPRKALENPFADVWRGGNDLDAIELSETERVVDRISVLSDDVDTDLNLKIRFCSSPACTEIADDMAPEVWFQLERPFYVGEHTYWETADPRRPEWAIDTIPTGRGPVIVVDKCDIRGCVDGEITYYCRSDMRHLCEN